MVTFHTMYSIHWEPELTYTDAVGIFSIARKSIMYKLYLANPNAIELMTKVEGAIVETWKLIKLAKYHIC